jgi:3-methylcrotonyl-CoA carboxylase alpha subunit
MLEEESASSSTATDRLTSPMPATVIEVRVKVGDQVKEGQVCAVLESMKMEISIRAGRDGVVEQVNVDKGQTVEEGVVLVALKSVD